MGMNKNLSVVLVSSVLILFCLCACSKQETIVININGVSFTMVKVKGGSFMMGTPAEVRDDKYDEKPAHKVTLSTYYIGQTEVTLGLWSAVMDINHSQYVNSPVELVSWYECLEFIERLNQLTGKHFRLPTEAEWEYAARGGRKSKGYKYSGSDDIDAVAWFDGNDREEGTHLVAQKKPNELGLYDMSGNVAEWCYDWYDADYYSAAAQTNPIGPIRGYYRVNRGGFYWGNFGDCCVSDRSSNEPSRMYLGLGLRLALQP